jgi:hypothetical protein
MPPSKPAAKPSSAGKKPTGSKKDAKKDAGDAPTTDDSTPAAMAAPKNKEEVLAQVNLDGLPDCPVDQITEILRGKYDDLVKIFINYCKHSDCKTMETSTRLRLGADATGSPLPDMRVPTVGCPSDASRVGPQALTLGSPPPPPSRPLPLPNCSRIQEAHQ